LSRSNEAFEETREESRRLFALLNFILSLFLYMNTHTQQVLRNCQNPTLELAEFLQTGFYMRFSRISSSGILN
jgi:hypothetical protein